MAEEKRAFTGGKVNRDLDDRLVPNGEYRDALNINIGESEGSDIGAIENLKGNQLITGQGGIEGRTIGTVRDPNNDRLYWFTKGETSDAIYEYDATTDTVNTIAIDPVARAVAKPTCVPDLTSFISDPDDDVNVRPDLPPFPSPPVGGCTNPTGTTNFNPNAEFDDGSCITAVGGCTNPAASNFNPNANVDDGSCTFAAFAVNLACPTIGTTGTDITLTATPVDAVGTVTFSWAGGAAAGRTTQAVQITETVDGSVTYTVTATDSSTSSTATASCTVVWSAFAPTIFTYTHTINDSSTAIPNTTVGGGLAGEEGFENIDETVGYTAFITPDTGFEWETPPEAVTTGLPAGITQSAVMGGTAGSALAASVDYSGTWTPIADVNATTGFINGTTRPETLQLTCSFVGLPDEYIANTFYSIIYRVETTVAVPSFDIAYAFTNAGTAPAGQNVALTVGVNDFQFLIQAGSTGTLGFSVTGITNPVQAGGSCTSTVPNTTPIIEQQPEWSDISATLTINPLNGGPDRRATVTFSFGYSGRVVHTNALNIRPFIFCDYNINGRSYSVNSSNTGTSVNEGTGNNQITNGGTFGSFDQTNFFGIVVHVFDSTFESDFDDIPANNIVTLSNLSIEGVNLAQTTPNLVAFPTFPSFQITDITNQGG